MGMIINCMNQLSIPGISQISINKRIESDGYKTINLLLPVDGTEITSSINFESVQLLLIKTTNNKYSKTMPVENNGEEGNNAKPIEKHIKYRFKKSGDSPFLIEPIFVLDEDTIKKSYGDYKNIYFKNETEEERQIEIYLIYSKSGSSNSSTIPDNPGNGE